MMNKSIKALCLAGLSFLSFSFAQSQISSNLSFSLTSGPFLPVDANSCGVDLPTAYLVGVKAVNSGSTEINVGTLTLDSLPNSGWSVIGPLNAEVKIGKLAANQERTAFYYVRANCSDQGNLVGLRLTANNGSNTQYFRTSLTVEGIISANSAGSINSNYANLDVIGSIVYDTITFSFSGFRSGNHHLMSPSSLVTFKATLLELQECEVLSVSHTGLGIAAGDINKTYFKAGFNAQGSTNYTVTQEFKWKVVDFGDSTLLVPMSANQQGGTNIKGLVADSSWGSTGKPVVISSSANTISLTKSVSPSRYSQGDTLTYSLKVSNSSSLADVAIDYINDTLPSGLTFIGIDQTGDVDSVDLSSIPTLSSTGNIQFIGGSQDATTGDISIQVPKSSSVTLKYKVKAGTTATGDLINKAGVFVGARALDTARVTISEYGAPALDTLKTVAITCNGGSDGEVHLTANDAPRPFTWSKDGTNYQSDSSFKNLTSGSYTFYAKSNSGKISTINVTLTNPNALSISGGNSVCVGSDITLTGSGTSATTNAWVSATTSVATITSAGVLTGVSSGTSVITYTDNNGCTVTETVTVNALPTVAVSPTSASITSGNSQSLTASGATSYSWSSSTGLSATTGGTVTASPSTTTTYTVTGTDANGCVNTASSTITVGSSLTAGAIAGNTTICSGGDPAAFTSSSSASGGTGSYTYEWESSTNSGSTWSAISSSNSTTYDVPSGLTQTTQYRRKVSDGSNTAYSNTLTVTVNANPTITSSVTSVCDGSDITLTGSGTAATTNAWVSATTSVATITSAGVLTGVSSGTSVITYTDNNGCTVTETVTVNALPTVAVSPTSASITSGNSQSLTASGATSYSWSPSTGLSATTGGTVTASPTTTTTYTVTGTDANGCVNTASSTITVGSSLTAGAIAGNTTICSGGDPAAFTSSSSASGGTGSYTYEWESSTNSGSTWSAISSSNSTTYDVPSGLTQTTQYRRKVSDGSNTAYSNTLTVTVNANPTITSSVTSVCDGSDITLTGSGTAATTNAWVSATTSVATITSAGVLTGVSSGTSVITYTDNNGCTVTETVTVNALPTVAVSPTSASITSGNSQSLTASGANSYSWSPSTGLSATTGGTVTASPTTTTTYTVTGTDANGCVNTQTVTVEVTLDGGTIASDETLCSGGDPAAFTSSSSASGGTGSYTYEWESSTNSGSTWSAISSSNSTTYDVPSGLTQTTQYRRKVSDGSNTAYSNTLTVTVNANPNSSGVSVTNVSCNGGTDGSADITVTGGTSPYTYAWSGPSSYSSTSEDINTLSAGTYSVTVTDANSCTSSNTNVVVTEPTALTLSNGSQTNVDCNGNSTGSVTVSAAGGTSPYEYKIGMGSYGTSATFSSLSAGSYTVTAKDANGCTQTLSVTITEPAAALSSSGVSVTNVSCNGGTDGSADITVTGGTSPYTYAWSGPSSYSSTSEDINTLSAGTYSVTVTDANSCTSSNTNVVVTEPTALTLSNGSQTNVDCNGNSTGSVTVSAAGGTSPYEYKIGTGSYGTSATFSSLSAGSYTVTAKDANGCTQTLSVTITEPAAISVSSISSTNVTCNGASDGTITITATGGGTLKYSIDNGSTYQSSNVFSALAPGSYTVVVSDNNNCNASYTPSQSVTITQPGILTLGSIVPTDPSCLSASDGKIVLNVTGGNTISYSIDSGTTFQGSNTFTGLSIGIYKAVIKDNLGCAPTYSNSQYVTLVNGDQTNPVAVVKNASVNLNASGSASISYSDIENGSSDNCGVTKIYLDDSTFNCSDAGVNKVILTVEDAAGNQDTAHAYVTVSDAINPVAVVKNASVNLNASGSASISYSDIENGSSDNCGVTKIYLDDSTFNCSDAGVNKVILTVEDAAGNQDTAHAYVTVSDAINPVAVVKNASVNLNASGSASISYSDIENGSSDNCGVTKIYLDD